PHAGHRRGEATAWPAIAAAMLCGVAVSMNIGKLPIALPAMRADLGLMISASHNPAPDNGIKLFGPDGRKLADSVEVELERLMEQGGHAHPTGPGVGKLLDPDDSVAAGYAAFLSKIVPGGLSGMKIAVDAANGAAFRLGPQIFESLGAVVHSTNVSPDGDNINVN
ncbi:MAG TPA: hypothetical protein PKA27_05090, partial [Fimbriimonadaceae bacterium]|nr:hypothetical protein [Fimbriimonadaceae bacterium]